MDFFDKMKDFMDKGIEVSKEAILKAGSKVQDIGDKSVTKIEAIQLQHKLEKEFSLLGLQVWDVLCHQNESSVSPSDSRISGILDEISRLKDELEKRTGK
ncbi:MAG TPA: hypothetical protein PLU33_12090 [Treponemataceae bacterium]|jgi:hypothetical protein|nr:hypothetical protein [Treponemataceae bacterium]HQL05870.1 hypothetical protein [Treponemataceae bacterium]